MSQCGVIYDSKLHIDRSITCMLPVQADHANVGGASSRSLGKISLIFSRFSLLALEIFLDKLSWKSKDVMKIVR